MGPVDEIELDDVADAGAVAGPATAPGASSRRRRPAAPWVAAAVGLVVAGALAAPPGGVRIGEDEAGTGLGVRALDLGERPTEVWRTELDLAVEGYQVLQVRDGVVVVTGAAGLIGYDLDDGSARWTLDLSSPICVDGLGLVCVEAPGTIDAGVVRIDPATGRTDRMARPGASVATLVDGGGAVAVLEVDPGTTPGMTTLRPPRLVLLRADGTERWKVDTALVHDPAWGPLWNGLVVRDGVVHLSESSTSVEIATGEPAPSDASSSWLDDRTELRSSEASVTTGGAESTGSRYPRFDVLLDGELVARDQEVLMRPDDALGGDVDLRNVERSGSNVVVAEGAAGEELWRSDPDSYPYARLDGVVVLGSWTGAAGLVGVDARTGARMWERDDDVRVASAGSGTTLLTTDDSGTLAGLDVRTGRTRWTSGVTGFYGPSVDVPTGMVLVSGTELVRLAWPG